jgi:hypothetical protein
MTPEGPHPGCVRWSKEGRLLGIRKMILSSPLDLLSQETCAWHIYVSSFKVLCIFLLLWVLTETLWFKKFHVSLLWNQGHRQARGWGTCLLYVALGLSFKFLGSCARQMSVSHLCFEFLKLGVTFLIPSYRNSFEFYVLGKINFDLWHCRGLHLC